MAMKSARDMEAMFDDAFPILFQKEVFEIIHKCYGDAESSRNVYGLLWPIFAWNRPYIRRALIQSHLFELAARWKLEANWYYTAAGANPYVEIRAANFVLTESKVDEAYSLPRDAFYRTDNAAVNYSLFADQENTIDPINVIVTHVPHAVESRPTEVGVSFPDGDYTRVVHRIDFHGRFFAQITPPAPPDGRSAETPALDPQPKLRGPSAPDEKKAGGGA
jgi:hypothetical protein